MTKSQMDGSSKPTDHPPDHVECWLTQTIVHGSKNYGTYTDYEREEIKVTTEGNRGSGVPHPVTDG